MQTTHKNKFGSVAFRLVSDVLPVGDIRGADIESAHKFDIDTAEKIALITENGRVQICPVKEPGGWRFYVVLHATESTAAVAAIDSMHYTGANPRQEIRNARTWARVSI